MHFAMIASNTKKGIVRYDFHMRPGGTLFGGLTKPPFINHVFCSQGYDESRYLFPHEPVVLRP
jgi:hypothetical protein